MSTSNLFGNLTPPVSDEEEKKEVIENQEDTTPPADQEFDKEVVEESDKQDEEEVQEKKPSQLDVLKQRADLMGIKYSNNIGEDALRQKIRDKLEPKQEVAPVASQESVQTNPSGSVGGSTPKKISLRKKLMEENMKLVRVRITNFDEKDKNLNGAIITVANEYLGIVRKYVHYGVEWHVPYCIYKFLRDKKFLQIRTVKKNGKETVEQNIVNKYAIEILPPLTDKEMATLAASQLGSGAIDKE